MNYEIQIYTRQNGETPVLLWLESLDETIAGRIKTRIDRISLGNFGDCKSVGAGIYELKMRFGAGYRVYYAKIGAKIILLLSSGNKATQNKDIKNARKYLIDYLTRS